MYIIYTITPCLEYCLFLAGHFKLMHRKYFPDVDSLTRCCSEPGQVCLEEACEQLKIQLRKYVIVINQERA